MQIEAGLLVAVKPKQSFVVVARKAQEAFREERGREPEAYHLNPSHQNRPPSDKIEGLPVILDEAVKENHLLVCCYEGISHSGTRSTEAMADE
ncbi:MAG: hypothetical protein AAF485_03225 [Chloroflexota bacterium]